MPGSTDQVVLGKPGRCIYCGADDVPLNKEHVVPYALSGPWLLLKASCKKHEAITGAFERSVCRDSLLKVRAAFGLRTRRKGNRPKTFPLNIRVNGKPKVVRLPAEDHFVPVILPVFPPPAYLSGRSYQNGIENIGVSVSDKFGGRTFEELNRRYGVGNWEILWEYDYKSFARMIAKIGYGFAVGYVGFEEIEEAYVLPAILGQADDIGRWVGCDEGGDPLNPTTGLHAVQLRYTGRELHAVVRLFAQLGAEEYRVVIGRVSEKGIAGLITD